MSNPAFSVWCVWWIDDSHGDTLLNIFDSKEAALKAFPHAKDYVVAGHSDEAVSEEEVFD